MDEFIDLPVGTEFGYGGKRYQVIEAPDPGMCEGCITNVCKALTCIGYMRHDGIDVIVIEKEESNE